MKIETNDKMLIGLLLFIGVIATFMIGSGLAAALNWYAPGNINGGNYFNVTNMTQYWVIQGGRYCLNMDCTHYIEDNSTAVNIV